MRLRDKLGWRFHIQGQMRALGVIENQGLITPTLNECQVVSLEWGVAEFFPAQRAQMYDTHYSGSA